jgi:hypothetical protein
MSVNAPLSILDASSQVWTENNGVPEEGNNKALMDYLIEGDPEDFDAEDVIAIPSYDTSEAENDLETAWDIPLTTIIGGGMYYGAEYVYEESGTPTNLDEFDLDGIDLEEQTTGNEFGYFPSSLGYFPESMSGTSTTYRVYTPSTRLYPLGSEESPQYVEMAGYNTDQQISVLFFYGYKPYGTSTGGRYYLTYSGGGTVPDYVEMES